MHHESNRGFTIKRFYYDNEAIKQRDDMNEIIYKIVSAHHHNKK